MSDQTETTCPFTDPLLNELWKRADRGLRGVLLRYKPEIDAVEVHASLYGSDRELLATIIREALGRGAASGARGWRPMDESPEATPDQPLVVLTDNEGPILVTNLTPRAGEPGLRGLHLLGQVARVARAS